MSTMDEQTVERVKNAIGFQAWRTAWPPHQTDTLVHDMYERMARAAIAAMPDTKALEAADRLADAVDFMNETGCRLMTDISKEAVERLTQTISFEAVNAEIDRKLAGDINTTLRAQAARIAELTGERDRQYEQNVEFIVKIAELEAQVSTARTEARREAHNIVAAKARETDSADARFDLASAGLQILAMIDKEPNQ